MNAEAAASVIAHELGVMRAGLTRHEPSMMILLAPWKFWLTFILIMWGIAAAFLPHRLMVGCLVINAGIGLWLGATEHPVMYTATAGMAMVLATWWTLRSWDRARAHAGDQYLLHTDLADAYSDLLTANFTDDYNRDRAVRLTSPQQQPQSTAAPDASRRTAIATNTTGR